MHRGDIKTVSIDKLEPNDWNPNQQSDLVFDKEKRSIETLGFVSFPVVRTLKGGKFQILDGEHRWRAAKEGGHKEITINDLGTVDDDEARLFTELMNAIHGQNDPVKHAEMLNQFLANRPEWKELLPYTGDHLESLLNPSFDWESLSKNDTSGADGEGASPTTELAIKMSEEQLEVCQRAIAAAKDTGDCETDARAMELICAEFLSGK